MRESLRRWVADIETRYSIEDFALESHLRQLNYLDGRSTDLYFSLVGELFDRVRDRSEDQRGWATLGNALASISRDLQGVSRSDALFFSAAAFYSGGYSASAYLTMRQTSPNSWNDEAHRACYDLLARPSEPASKVVRDLISAVREGTLESVERAVVDAERNAEVALVTGPDEWIPRRLFAALVRQFGTVNLRSALPDGGSQRWTPLVQSFLDRRPPVWEFFPSQVEAIDAGLLTSTETYSLQMPTGAGKTALTETLLFSHLTTASPDSKAVLLVPYRALARELRHSLGRRLSRLGLPTKTIYGGTVPSLEESEDLENVRVLIATPEALTGLLGAHPEILSQLSLIVCDEGHLLDGGSRGIGLELLLARLKSRVQRPRMVFVSAIVPNVEEINTWLGGSDSTVVRSDFKPAVAEYAVLRPVGAGTTLSVGLELQELSTTLPAHTLSEFLQRSDFQYVKRETGRLNTYPYSSAKTQAVAAARKSLALGTVAIFAATKTGDQGVLALANELIKQIESDLPLPAPVEYVRDRSEVDGAAAYLAQEFGSGWTGTKALLVGLVVHHGDIPQEAREVLEELVSARRIPMVMCTSTLAEGVNLPIRTLVLYSVRRGSASGRPVPMLARDIKNLVGRAGRAGNSTKGLVICANPNQWDDVLPVAAGQPGERVEGALIDLLRRLQAALTREGLDLTNQILEDEPELFPLVDGIDSTLVELIHGELGQEEFLEIAESLASSTFAAQQIDDSDNQLLQGVFTLRASRVYELQSSGRLSWIRDTGARPRILDSVLNDLYPTLATWDSVDSPLDEQLLDAVLGWVFHQGDFQRELAAAYRREKIPDAASLRELVTAWLDGRSFAEMAEVTGLDIDTLLRVHAKVVMHALVTLVEQGVALLQRVSAESGAPVSDSVVSLPGYLRFGVSTSSARALMAGGLRHRRSAVALGNHVEMSSAANIFASPMDIARQLLQDSDDWNRRLGTYVYQRTLQDVTDEGPSQR
ncbi:DEAD/DEAH box helicase [Arthrobacter sp. NPDC058127]|uniref:DEAD/DEAH box helicase n=1 Tax=Arthrobacter sp. NPDC058127 TaxID=3346351 RepID=UPI0036E84D4D